MSQQPDTRAVKEYLLGLQERICQRLEAVASWGWDAFAADWEEGFGHLVAYVADAGSARVPDNYSTAGGYGLGTWVNSQRSAKKKGKLSADRRQRLEAVKDWVWGIHALRPSKHGRKKP